jgi:hypothetical protein
VVLGENANSNDLISSKSPCLLIFPGEAQERFTTYGARENNQCDMMFNRAPRTLDRVPSAGLNNQIVEVNRVARKSFAGWSKTFRCKAPDALRSKTY